MITCRELKYKFDSEFHCLFSVDCSLHDKGKILWTSSSPEKYIGYSKDDAEDLYIDTLVPPSIQVEHSRCLDEYLNTGASEKMFRKSSTVIMRSDGFGQLSEMWMKPYIHCSPIKPVLLSLNRKVSQQGSFYCVTDGYGYVDCVSKEYNFTFGLRFPFNEQINSILCYAPDLLTYFLEVSQNFKGKLPAEELVLDKSSTRISKNPSLINEAVIKLDWFGINKQQGDLDLPSLNRKIWEGSSFNLQNIIARIKNIPRSNKEVFTVKLKIVHQHLKNGTTMFFIHLISFGDKKPETRNSNENDKKDPKEKLVKMDSIDAQIHIKNENEEYIENQDSDVKEVKFSSCTDAMPSKIEEEGKANKLNSVNNMSPSKPKTLNLVQTRFKLIKNLVTIAHIIRSGEKVGSSQKLESKETNELMKDKTTGDNFGNYDTDGYNNDVGLAQIQNQKRRRIPFVSLFWQQAGLMSLMSAITGIFLIAILIVFKIVL